MWSCRSVRSFPSPAVTVLVALALVVWLVTAAAESAGSSVGTRPVEIRGLGEFRVSGPYQHKNLALYVVQAVESERLDDGLITLQSAMANKRVVVHETGNVNELVVENQSGRRVFVQAGDILKGGHQDRVIAYDLMLEPDSGKVSLAAFCVESGRWGRRGSERARSFAGAPMALSGNKLKLAVREAKSQSGVWTEVANVQGELTERVTVAAFSEVSPTSMQLTLENKQVGKKARRYRKALADSIDGKSDVVGVVMAINGEPIGANLFRWPDLFAAQWPRLLQSASVEAVASKNAGGEVAAPALEAVAEFLKLPAREPAEVRELLPGLAEWRLSDKQAVRFVSKYGDLGWMRAEYLSLED